MNGEITAKEIRLISENGNQIGTYSLEEALNITKETGLDLVEIAPHANPPVCKMMDYGKFKYQQHKKFHDAKKKQRIIHVKEIKLRPKTEEHDFQFKLKNARKFLQDGNKVKLTILFRGRELAHREIGEELLTRMASQIEDVGNIEQKPRQEGRNMIMIAGPKNIHGSDKVHKNKNNQKYK
ncbi:MAG: translation initiation factor IF-3 [bacterium]